MKYDIIVIGSGPGGYVAAIKAAQNGMKTAVVEASELGGVCLNWGCIPTKAMVKSAQVFHYVQEAAAYGIELDCAPRAAIDKIVARSRGVADTMSKGVAFLMKKNNIDVIKGWGRLAGYGRVEVVSVAGNCAQDASAANREATSCAKESAAVCSKEHANVSNAIDGCTKDNTTDVCAKSSADNGAGAAGETTILEADHIILATGSRPREMPFMPIDGRYIISSRHALVLDKLPESMVVVGSGAIGCEFAYLYATLGVKVTVVEYLPQLLPVADEDVSKTLERVFRKMKVAVMTDTTVRGVTVNGEGKCEVAVAGKKGEQTLVADVVLSAVGVKSNLENLGLEAAGVVAERDKVVVDKYYRTNVKGVYAIGDITAGPALAHVASAEAICCVEAICDHSPKPIDYTTIPSCVYTWPEIAMVGMTERQAREAGLEIRVGQFPFTASGKATAAGDRDGFVKLIFNATDNKLVGAHMMGGNVTEMLGEPTLAKAMGLTVEDIISTIHPHPTMNEAIMEAAEAALGHAVHI